MKQFEAMDDTKFSVIAPGRLHMGFIDMHGGLGRQFGSLGLCLSEIYTELSVSPAKGLSAEGPDADRALTVAREILSSFGIDEGVAIRIRRAIPPHTGLGSGTQMALAVGSAITRLFEIDSTSSELASILDRGNRSGIGIGGFLHGGFIVDGGRSSSTLVPPVISHLKIPESWRFVLVFDESQRGLEGDKEKAAFTQLPAMSEATAAMLCRLVLMQVLPAVAENDCQQFGAAVTTIQEMMGDYFYGSQGGMYNSVAVGDVLPAFLAHGATGIGQSSWGPTGFAIFPHETNAYQALKQLKSSLQGNDTLKFMVCRCRNMPALVQQECGRLGDRVGQSIKSSN